MTPREFFNAWIGWNEARNEMKQADRNIIYGAAKYHAINTAWGEKQSRQIKQQKFPWESKKKNNQNGLSVHQKIGSFVRREEHRLKRKEQQDGN